MSRKVFALRIVALVGALCLSQLSFASLGGDVSTVQADQAHMKASVRIMAATGYTMHEIAAESGITVREYVSPAGKVFAVSWEGPAIPDMRQVMGVYFDQYTQAAQARRRHGPLVINEPGLVVEMSGHMRAFSGRAYIPGFVPSSVSIESIQ